MKKITFGIIAHVDSGKTTLSEAMLYKAGVIRNFGRVDKGESFLDTDAVERQRGITIYSKQACFEYGNTSFNLIDTPGHSDFSAEMERTLQVLDVAVLIISAADGVRGQSETLWKLLNEYEIPTFVFINKMDRPDADGNALLIAAKKILNDSIVDFSDYGSQSFYDMVAMCDEKALEEFLENGLISDNTITTLIDERKLFPCYFGSALNMKGVDELLRDLDKFTMMPNYEDSFGARAFKIMRDESGNRLTFLKIMGGKLSSRDTLLDGTEETKITRLRVYSGEKYLSVTEANAGDICAVEGLENSHAGDGYGTEKGVVFPIIMPVICVRALFPNGDDPVLKLKEFKMLEEESPEMYVRWEEDTREISICVMGDVQLEIIKDTFQKRFNTNVEFDYGRVLYCETITKPVIGVGHFEPLRHYAEVQLLMEPLEEGSGLVFDTDVSTDLLAKNWQRLILTHLYEKEHRGVLIGAPITDMKITLIAGKAHLKHTEGGDFRQATYRAVRQGLMMTQTKLLEPYYRFTLELPIECVGKAMTDLDKMLASISAPDTDINTGMASITGRVPVSCFRGYPRDVISYTKGLGHVSMAPDGYGPCHNEEEVIDSYNYDPTSDLRNTPDSVFCSHGAGVVIPYNEVYEHMHIPFDKKDINVANTQNTNATISTKSTDIWLGVDEVDEIIASIGGLNGRLKAAHPGWKRKGRKTRKNSSATVKNAQKIDSQAGTRVFDKKQTQYLLVDGYNVIFAWDNLKELAEINIDSARDSLLDTLCDFQAMADCEVIAVFDAYRVKGHKTEYSDYHNIHVVFTAEAETADAYIEKFAHDNAHKHKVTVVTSDGLEQIIIRGEGCALISSREFKGYIDETKNTFNARFDVGEA